MLKKIDSIGDIDKPTLIVGWEKTKKLYPNQRIINKKISDKLFWTFSEKEKRTDYEQDIKKFRDYCLEYFDADIDYFFINPFELSYSNIKKLIRRLKKTEGKIYYFDDKHFFILDNTYVFGLNTDFLELTTISTEKIKKWLERNNFETFTKNEIFNIEEILEEKNKRYLIPSVKKILEYEKEFIIGYIFE